MSTVVRTEETIRKTTTGCDRDWGQRRASRDIANCEDVRNVGALPSVRRNKARRVKQDAPVVQVHGCRCRLSSNSPYDGVVRPEPTTVLSRKVVGAVLTAPQRRRHHSADDVDSKVSHLA